MATWNCSQSTTRCKCCMSFASEQSFYWQKQCTVNRHLLDNAQRHLCSRGVSVQQHRGRLKIQKMHSLNEIATLTCTQPSAEVNPARNVTTFGLMARNDVAKIFSSTSRRAFVVSNDKKKESRCYRRVGWVMKWVQSEVYFCAHRQTAS